LGWPGEGTHRTTEASREALSLACSKSPAIGSAMVHCPTVHAAESTALDATLREGLAMSVEWDWMLRAAVEQAKAEEIDRDDLAADFEALLAEVYSE
jgi:hypothetical protein